MGTTLDYLVIGVYFAVVLGFGSFFGRGTRSTKDFFFAGQRLSWWLVGLSLVATLVGSYSFVKYSAMGHTHGLASSFAYLNDWIWLPLFMFGWLPIIYFARVRSIPEYFERRFDRSARVAATIILLIYMVGYIGINFYTLGVALGKVLGWDVFTTAAIIAVVTAVYVTAGGQTAVIMTDLLQGILLLCTGFAVLLMGWYLLGDGRFSTGAMEFWNHLSPVQRRGLPPYNDPASFNFVGIFWQDGMANSLFFYFMNQGLIMRFLAVRSVEEGRKAAWFMVFLLVPLAAIAVSAGGWLGPALVATGVVPADTKPRDIFVAVTYALSQPGVFGLILAALTAALMSSADSLINAVAAVFVNDLYQPYVRRRASDRHYLRVARWTSVFTALVGILLVPVFMSFGSIYRAHGAFTAACTPPMVVALLLGLLWPRFTSRAALWTLAGGAAATALSFVYPILVAPLAHGTAPDASALKSYTYIRALFSLVVSGAIGVGVTLVTAPRPRESLAGLVLGRMREAMRRYKGGEPNPGVGAPAVLRTVVLPGAAAPVEDWSMSDEASLRTSQWPEVRLAPRDLERLGAASGDLLFVAHPAWWHGGLRGVHARAAAPGGASGEIALPVALLRQIKVSPGGRAKVRKIL